MEDTTALVVAGLAAIAFPVVAIWAHGFQQRRHARKMGRRKTDKIKL